MMKRTIFVALVVLLITAATSTFSVAGHSNPELSRAIDLGFGVYRADDPAVTYAEFFEMLDKAVERADRTKLEIWKEQFPEARASNNKMIRIAGMMAVLKCAQALGSEYLDFNAAWWEYNDSMEEAREWDSVFGMPNLFLYIPGDQPYSDDGFESAEFVKGWSFVNVAYIYSYGRASRVSGNLLFDYDETSNSMRRNAPFKYSEALLAALRLCESVPPKVSGRVTTDEDKELLAAADARREAILNSPTAVSVTGKSYYVSNRGNDKNNGETPDKAWATLEKVNKAKLKPGDAVFFERGCLWRGYIDCKKGVTYSAYGMGEKPKIYGSQENGADPAKWLLWHDEDDVKIWKFYRAISEVGNIVFDNGYSYAERVFAYFNGTNWVVSDTDQRLFNIVQELKQDLQFYSTFPCDAKKYDKYEKFPSQSGYVVWTNMIDTEGDLYLRCDRGNPGDIFGDMEFHTAPKGMSGYVGLVHTKGNNVIDNLCIRYNLCQGIAINEDETIGHFNNGSNCNNVIQNCEIGWVGGGQQAINDPLLFSIGGFGEVIVFTTDGNTIRNNYIYQGAGVGICTEFVAENRVPGVPMCENNVIEGNLIEHCGGLIAFVDNIFLRYDDKNYYGDEYLFWKDMKLVENIAMYSGDSFNRYTNRHNSEGDSRLLSINASPRGIENILIQNNVFYLSADLGVVFISTFRGTDPYDITFSGNTYVANDYGLLLETTENIFSYSADQILSDVERLLGDTTAKTFLIQ